MSLDNEPNGTPNTPPAESAAPPSPPPSPPSAPAASPASDFVSVRDAFKSHGLDLSGVPDDESAVRQIAQQLGQANQYRQQLAEHDRFRQQVLPNWSKFQEWQAQQAQQAEAEAAKKKAWWNPIDIDPNWQNQIVRDQQGNLSPAPGAPPDVVQRAMETANRKAEFERSWLKNPIEAIRPGLEQLIQEKAQALIEQQMERFQAGAFVQQFEQANANWLYQGRDQQGQPVLSNDGEKFLAHVEAGRQIGIRGSANLEKFARNAMLGELGLSIVQGQQNGQPPVASPAPTAPAAPADPRQALLDKHNRNRGGNLNNPSAVNGEGSHTRTAPKGPRMLRSMLTEAVQASGLTPDDFKP